MWWMGETPNIFYVVCVFTNAMRCDQPHSSHVFSGLSHSVTILFWSQNTLLLGKDACYIYCVNIPHCVRHIRFVEWKKKYSLTFLSCLVWTNKETNTFSEEFVWIMCKIQAIAMLYSWEWQRNFHSKYGAIQACLAIYIVYCDDSRTLKWMLNSSVCMVCVRIVLYVTWRFSSFPHLTYLCVFPCLFACRCFSQWGAKKISNNSSSYSAEE